MISFARFVSIFLITIVTFGYARGEQVDDRYGKEGFFYFDLIVKEVQEWILGKRDSEWGWQNSTHEAVVTLALTDPRILRRNTLENQLTIKQLSLQLAVALQQNGKEKLSAGQLAQYINALLLVCRDPRNFYGMDLVTNLYHSLTNTKYEFALVTLTLCNAGVDMNTPLMHERLHKLQNTLSRSQEGRLNDDEAMAVLALQCALSNTTDHQLSRTVEKSRQKFGKLQNPQNGGFGNIYSTGLFAQALLDSGKNVTWNKMAALDYLALNLQKSVLHSKGNDMLAPFLALPPLTGRTLLSISTFDCTAVTCEKDATQGWRSPLSTTVGVVVIAALGFVLIVVLTVHLSIKLKCFRKKKEQLISDDDYIANVASSS